MKDNYSFVFIKFQKFLKTKITRVYFCSKVKPHNNPCLHSDGNEIQVVKEVTFLSVIYDYNLSYRRHIKMFKEKCTKALKKSRRKLQMR